jgi:hypothetical protein
MRIYIYILKIQTHVYVNDENKALFEGRGAAIY